ncbi:MAG: twin-arginine translocase subunit TatC [Thermoleophilaceae bacterium]|nr:twin-arginine translocase subunit TatC [Thermoleophilaceae bacterium]
MAVARRIKPVNFDDRLSVVDHLDELRTRIVVSLGALIAAYGVCFWQKDFVLDTIQRPLDGRDPITFSPTEPFLTTLTVCAYAAILICLPFLLYQVYSFVLPAFSPTEKKVALPMMLMVPVLFIGGVVFAYYIVLPPALDFLLGFNAENFQTEIRAKDYYSFATLGLLLMGVLFQVPILVLTLCRLGITTPEKLRKNRRYAILGLAILAAALPSVDPVTMILEMIPLILLYEFSIVLAAWLGRPDKAIADAAVTETPGDSS